MKLLHVVGDSKFGGGAFIIMRLVERGKRLGWQVSVLTTDRVFGEHLRTTGTGVINEEMIWRDIRPWRDLQGLYRLYRFLRQNDFTCVHTHTSKAGLIGRLAARMAGVPVIVHTVHGFAFHEQSHPLTVMFYAFLEKIAAACCDRIITVSEFHRAWALRLGIGNALKVVAIANGISDQRITAVVDRAKARQSLGITPGEVAILTTGRLAPQKGLEYLLAAVPILNRQLTRPFTVLLAGDGILAPRLNRMIGDLGIRNRVRLLGFRDDIGMLLAASDMVVLPTLREGLSIALLEAMAAARPIVTTTIGSNLEVTQNGRAALLVPPQQAPALAAAIIRLIENEDLQSSLAGRAREIFVACYTEERMLKAYEEMYGQFLREGPGR